jgi:hypothetical protein
VCPLIKLVSCVSRLKLHVSGAFTQSLPLRHGPCCNVLPRLRRSSRRYIHCIIHLLPGHLVRFLIHRRLGQLFAPVFNQLCDGSDSRCGAPCCGAALLK